MIEPAYYAYGRLIKNDDPSLSYGAPSNPKALSKKFNIFSITKTLAKQHSTDNDTHKIKQEYMFKNLTEAVQKINKKDISTYASGPLYPTAYIQIENLLGYKGKDNKGIRGWICRQQVTNFYHRNNAPCNGYVFLIDPNSVEENIIINGNNYITVKGKADLMMSVSQLTTIDNPFILGKKVYLYDYGEISAIECVKAKKILNKDIMWKSERTGGKEKWWSKDQQITDEQIAESHVFTQLKYENKIKLDDYELRPVTNKQNTEEISFEEILVGKHAAPRLRQYKSMKLYSRVTEEQKNDLLKNPAELEKKRLEIINDDILEDNEKQLNIKCDDQHIIKLDFRKGEMKQYVELSVNDAKRYNTLIENKEEQAKLQQKIDEQQKKMTKDKQTYDQKVNKLTSKITEINNINNQYQDTLEQQKQYIEALEKNKTDAQKAIEQLQKKKNEAINQITAEKDVQMKTMQEKAEQRITEAQEDAQKKIDEADRKIAQAQEDARKEIEDANNKADQKITEAETEANKRVEDEKNKAELAEYQYNQQLLTKQQELAEEQEQMKKDFEKQKDKEIAQIKEKTTSDFMRENGQALDALRTVNNSNQQQIYRLNARVQNDEKKRKEYEEQLKQQNKLLKSKDRELAKLISESKKLQTLKSQTVIVKPKQPLNSFISGGNSYGAGGYAPPPPIPDNYDPLIIQTDENSGKETENKEKNKTTNTPDKKNYTATAVGFLVGVPLSFIGGLGIGDVINIDKGLSIGILAVGAGIAILCVVYDLTKTEKPKNKINSGAQNNVPTKPVNNSENVDNNLETDNGQLLDMPM